MTTTDMRREIEEIPTAVARLLGSGGGELQAAGAALRAADPLAVATIARGSSDHACAFLKYAFEVVAGTPVASIGPSVASIYRRPLRLARFAAIAVSQSGRSPDIVSMAGSARQQGAVVIALTNTPGSPLAAAADIFVDLRAGEERSVAATKSFVNSVVANLALVAHSTGNTDLLATLEGLPSHLETAISLDWSPLFDVLSGGGSAYVLGRGPTLAIAAEAALKLKETCALHAEAYSAAEVVHGPARIVEAGFPVLALAAADESEASTAEVADRLAGQGARAFITSAASRQARELPRVRSGNPLVDAIGLIVTFYAFVEELSRRRGFDPDRPPHLKKVTETL